MPTASLSYLPIYVALQKGFFAKRVRRHGSESDQRGGGTGGAGAAQPGDRLHDDTSGPATAGARGAPLKIICFTSVKLQHVLIQPSRDHDRRRLGRQTDRRRQLRHSPGYEVRVLIEKYRLGANTIIVPLNSTNDRMIGTQRGTIDATVVPAPFDLKAEQMGLRRLLGDDITDSASRAGHDRGKN